jgi:hypothetical protein
MVLLLIIILLIDISNTNSDVPRVTLGILKITLGILKGYLIYYIYSYISIWTGGGSSSSPLSPIGTGKSKPMYHKP